MSCSHDPGRLSDDGLSRRKRLALLDHVRRCPHCSAELAASEPAALFSLLALDTPSADELERLSARVDAEIAAEPQPAGSATRWMSVAASLILAGVFATYLWTRPAVLPETANLRQPLLDSLDLHAIPAADAAGSVEWVASPGTAQVMDLSVGEMQVVMIFDEAMDI